MTGLQWIINEYQFIITLCPCFMHQDQFLYTEHVIKIKQHILALLWQCCIHFFLQYCFFSQETEGLHSLQYIVVYSPPFSPFFITLFTRECVNMELLRNWLLLSSVQCGLPPINLSCLQKKLKIHVGPSLQTIVWKTRSIQIELESMWNIHKQEHH